LSIDRQRTERAEIVPQLAHIARVVVMSGMKTSLKIPAAEFPSSLTASPTRSSPDSFSDARPAPPFIAASMCLAHGAAA